MILVVLLSRKFGVNPDNVATPIAASLGDLITLSLLANFTQVSKLSNVNLLEGLGIGAWF